MSDVSQQYQALGAALRERRQQLAAMLEKMQEVQEEASSMLKWLESKERTLSELDASSSPTKTETMRAQAEHNKVTPLPEEIGDLGISQRVSEMCLVAAHPCSPAAKICPGARKGFPQEGSRAGRCAQLLFAFRPLAFRLLAPGKGAFYLQPLLLGYSSFSWKAIPSLSPLSEPS